MIHPHFFIHTKRNIEAFGGCIIGLKGRFDVELIHARTGLVKRKLSFSNLITDSGLNTLMSHSARMYDLSYMEVGTGSTPPDVSDVQLESLIAGTSSNGGFSDSSQTPNSGNNYEMWYRIERLFTQAQANGNLTEVGMRFNNSSGPLFCRHLFLDESDQPTTIVKTSEDQLRVSYTWESRGPVEVTGQPDVLIPTPSVPAGISTTVLNRAMAYLTNQNNSWGPSTSYGIRLLGQQNSYRASVSDSDTFPSLLSSGLNGSVTFANSNSIQSYVQDSFYRDMVSQWTASQANYAGGIGSLSFGIWAQSTPFCMTFSPKIPKTDTDRFVAVMRYQVARA